MKNLMNAAVKFGLEGNILKTEKLNSGHINQTYKIVYSENESYILQRINKSVFREPEKIMFNIKMLCQYINASGCSSYPEFLYFGEQNYFECENEFWRGYRFAENSVSYNTLTDLKSVYEFGRILGEFHAMTQHADSSQFYITIEDFHNTSKRIYKLKKYKTGRYRSEYNFFERMLCYSAELEAANLPLKVTHNDVKCSNVLFDSKTHEGISLIDFDTIMPGLHVYDFGDGARSGCITDNEFNIEKFRKFADGYFGRIKLYEPEDYFLGMICVSAELASRYFYDFLSGENYFADKTSEEKYARCHELISTAQSIEKHRNEIEKIIALKK